ncbi:flavin monoamine oxidase family protein [Leptolyngbya sp. PCC 6406]|uniref:flavin monoamine oxidase family protein n=1 Tax=Leptolyngbya sp. PCC 6406 TaxID=1173264 RepID=UPI0002ACC98A|nr:NAD(P)/FAD-dependent oxidoreductase [Leptolyngbya sp. PCC 6406]
MTEVIHYAIVGGGVSGAYCAWRLKQAYPDQNIVLFEYSDRIGGRLFTRQLPGITDINAELGGMRYLPSEHKIVHQLVTQLGLKSHPFPMGSPEDPSGQKNYAYLQGKNLFVGDFNNSNKVPYNLAWSEQNKTPDEIQSMVMRLLVPNWQELSFDDWFEVEVFGMPLWKHGFWNLLYRVLTPQAFQFLKYGSGYDTNVSNGNAVTLLPTGGDYSSTNQYVTLDEGMEALPRALADEFVDTYHGRIFRNYRLASIQRQEDRNYRLQFFETQTIASKTQDVTPALGHELVAEQVILAMPRRSLELIDWDCWQQDDFLRENLSSVLIQGALKFFLAYDYAWWQELGLVAGRSITDLPIRQTYYFTTPKPQNCSSVPHQKALLMASYNDIESIPFWKGLENGESFPGPEGSCASVLMVEEIQRQILELHNLRETPKPYAAAYHDWSEDPIGAGWHSWKAGFKYNEIMPKMRHPVSSERVYICGEAYSADQGWAEGALETAELLLKEDLQVPDHPTTEAWCPNYLRRLSY